MISPRSQSVDVIGHSHCRSSGLQPKHNLDTLTGLGLFMITKKLDPLLPGLPSILVSTQHLVERLGCAP
jgi:hypothetical protein